MYSIFGMSNYLMRLLLGKLVKMLIFTGCFCSCKMMLIEGIFFDFSHLLGVSPKKAIIHIMIKMHFHLTSSRTELVSSIHLI